MSKTRGSSQHSMQGVFVFVLLGLFAVMSTLMVLMGAQMYRGTVANAAENSEDRLLGAYVRSMVRAEDAKDAVVLEDYDGVATIALYETIDEDRYVTWIYRYDGELYEQFTEADFDFDPSMGMPICPVDRFEPSIEGRLLTVRMTDDKGEECVVQVALRCAPQAARAGR